MRGWSLAAYPSSLRTHACIIITASNFTHRQSRLMHACSSNVFGVPGRASPPQGINRQAMVCVPLYETLGDHAISYILSHSETAMVLAAPSKLGVLAKVRRPYHSLAHA